MSIVLMGSTSGSITLSEPAVAGSNTISLPAATGTAVITSTAVSAAGQIPFSTDGTSYTPTAKIVSGTTVASTSGTSIDFTSIPSWVKRITLMFSGVSTNGTALLHLQLGTSGGVQATGYAGVSGYISSSGVFTNPTIGFGLYSDSASDLRQGIITLSLLDTATGTWACSGLTGTSTRTVIFPTMGSKTLSGVLDRIRLTAGGTDTFDAGSINILYE
jgi:hypothetical protein